MANIRSTRPTKTQQDQSNSPAEKKLTDVIGILEDAIKLLKSDAELTDDESPPHVPDHYTQEELDLGLAVIKMLNKALAVDPASTLTSLFTQFPCNDDFSEDPQLMVVGINMLPSNIKDYAVDALSMINTVLNVIGVPMIAVDVRGPDREAEGFVFMGPDKIPTTRAESAGHCGESARRDAVLQVLNKALTVDKNATTSLLSATFPCNESMVNHSDFNVQFPGVVCLANWLNNVLRAIGVEPVTYNQTGIDRFFL